MFKEVFESSEEWTGSLHQHKETGRLWAHTMSLKMSFYFRKTLIILWRPGSCKRPGHYCSSSHYYFCFFHNLNVPRLTVCATLWCQRHSCREVYTSLHPEQEQITNSHIPLAQQGKSHLLSTQSRGVPSLSSLYSEHIELAASELPCLRKYRIFQLPSVPFPFLIVFSNTDCAALNSRASVIKSRSFQVNPQCPQAPWMLPAGWSHYESSRSITGTTEPGGAKISDVPPGRRIKLLLWRLGFVQEKRRDLCSKRADTTERERHSFGVGSNWLSSRHAGRTTWGGL